MKIGVISNWSPQTHGYDSSNETHLVNYFKTKKLLLEEFTEEDYDSDVIEMVAFLEMIKQTMMDLHCIRDIEAFKSIKIILYEKSYIYEDREFVSNFNNGINKIQKIWREYHKQKMKHYKSLKNIRHRQLYGKFPKFKFKH